MADKGIIFSAPMVRALLDGRKTQTRRLLKPSPDARTTHCSVSAITRPAMWMGTGPSNAGGTSQWDQWRRLPYSPGDRLYVREAHRLTDCTCTEACRMPGNVYYESGDNDERGRRYMLNRLRPSIHMPRWASRLTLTVTDVRVQRLQEISQADAAAEGLQHRTWKVASGDDMELCEGWSCDRFHTFKHVVGDSAREGFEILWRSLHTVEGERWQDNPWIVAVTFDVARGNIDQLAGGACG